jgi:hypothetical protein
MTCKLFCHTFRMKKSKILLKCYFGHLKPSTGEETSMILAICLIYQADNKKKMRVALLKLDLKFFDLIMAMKGHKITHFEKRNNYRSCLIKINRHQSVQN